MLQNLSGDNELQAVNDKIDSASVLSLRGCKQTNSICKHEGKQSVGLEQQAGKLCGKCEVSKTNCSFPDRHFALCLRFLMGGNTIRWMS